MEKKIEDYLNLYIGQDFRWLDGDNEWRNWQKLTPYQYKDVMTHNMTVQLLLRPIESITGNEAEELYKKYFNKEQANDWSGDNGSAYFKPKKVNPTPEHAIRIIKGEDYETGDFMIVASIIPWMLSKGFDIFGLIEAGLAIDKITL